MAQSDGVPANWTRPTTGWLTGEYVADERTLTPPSDLPSGTYRIVAGLYDPVTGQRLEASSGSDEVEIAEIEIVS